jgi:hypothetical protein
MTRKRKSPTCARRRRAAKRRRRATKPSGRRESGTSPCCQRGRTIALSRPP